MEFYSAIKKNEILSFEDRTPFYVKLARFRKPKAKGFMFSLICGR
jgi:hypothetical protein